jgi:hypothetical protein
VGLQIQLTTVVAGAPSSLVGVKQIFNNADVQVYQREGAKRTKGDGSWFEDNSPGVQWTGNHLSIDCAGGVATSTVRLDLIFDAKRGIWKGHLRRGDFDHYVTLVRSHPKAGMPKSPFVGTWHRGTLMNNCLHIVQTNEDTISAWSDDLVRPGLLRYANGINRPAETLEQYGSIALVEIVSPTTLLLELKAFSPICCSIPSSLKLPAGEGALRTPHSDPSPAAKWKRIRGASCTSEATSSR